MLFRGSLAAALAAVLLGAAPRPAPPAAFAAPAADRPAGASRERATDAVLPDGRIGAPMGLATLVGTSPLGVAVSPDGRYVIVSNGNQEQAGTLAPPAEWAMLRAGYSLVVVDAKTMAIASVYQAADASFYSGIAAVRDPANPGSTLVLASDGEHNLVRAFSLSASGTLNETQTIPVGGYPSKIAVAADGRVAYVTSNIADTVTAIDLTTRRPLHSAPVGFTPFGVALSATNVFVANSGLDRYQDTTPTRTPVFANVQGSESKSSSLSVLSLDSSGDIGGGVDPLVVRMDPIPDGTNAIGGAHPSDIAIGADGQYAYVALSNVDRVATVQLGADPHVVGGLDLREFLEGPYGTQPDAITVSKDGKRVYVALAGLNAVAILDARDPAVLHRLWLIPTGDFPSALTLSPDGRYLYVTSARGVDGWGILQRVDLKKLPLIEKTIRLTFGYNRSISNAKINPVVPPQTMKGDQRKSSAIDRVVYIAVGAGTFDSLFGDLGIGASTDASLERYPESVTPNFHALAKAYAIADNFYVDDMNPDLNQLYASSGIATAYALRTLPVNGGRAPFDAHGQDPDDYPRNGYIFNALAKAGLSYRDYGGLVNLSGYVPTRGRNRPTGLGGTYSLNIPALAALDGHIDLNYAGWNPQVTNQARAAEFIDDMGKLVQTDSQPAFSYVWLPADSGQMADADRALGEIVQFLSHTPHWSSTAIFVTSDGITNDADHVNRARTYALVISPLAKQGYVGHHHLSTTSILKTEEEVLGLGPIALRDLLSTDMADFFGDAPYPSGYDVRN